MDLRKATVRVFSRLFCHKEIKFVCLRSASCLVRDTDGVCLAKVAGVSQLERINRVATIYGGRPPPTPRRRWANGRR